LTEKMVPAVDYPASIKVKRGDPVEIIRNLVQSLIIIIILAMFLEMMLPAGDMRAYVKMVMGLLVIIAVVQAVGAMARWSWEGELPAVMSSAGGDQGQLPDILGAGKRISAGQQDLGIEQYRRGLAQQVRALAKLNQGLPVHDVEVNVQSDPGRPGFGQIKGIIITMGKHPEQTGPAPEGAELVDEVSPVTVQVGKPAPSRVTGEKPAQSDPVLVDILTSFYNIKPEQVKIIYN